MKAPAACVDMLVKIPIRRRTSRDACTHDLTFARQCRASFRKSPVGCHEEDEGEVDKEEH